LIAGNSSAKSEILPPSERLTVAMLPGPQLVVNVHCALLLAAAARNLRFQLYFLLFPLK